MSAILISIYTIILTVIHINGIYINSHTISFSFVQKLIQISNVIKRYMSKYQKEVLKATKRCLQKSSFNLSTTLIYNRFLLDIINTNSIC